MQYGAEFVLAIIAMAMLAGVVKSWIRARHGDAGQRGPFGHHGRNRGRRDESEEVEVLRAENARLIDRLEASEDRLAVLERIVTDRSYNLASEIEALRDNDSKALGQSRPLRDPQDH
ncbi:hypothetical protein SZ64_17845 [Erythrobacter sp. SG61-1L]|uniref:hypothetical protein n=1 Tax=Erythrobacter sp. SG61-1L TaxID=1603897 RepID=UPI0006C8FD8A|nr:hypothetical protein [Erythrobacter sp. SG61-1L]KPL69750.1 hypothetical protein SZ64_17600 [Erythrobacter sp. SG61-1L]KPL69797.1 hypothetical protein SZ64_17845 [Erythrobacter sp. SG61-1L]